MTKLGKNEYFKYLDNFRLCFPLKHKKEYMKYLDNPIYRPYLIRKKPLNNNTKHIESIKKETPITEEMILSLFPERKEPVFVAKEETQYDKADKKTALLMNFAEKKYPELWELDQGLFFRLQFQKLIPLDRDKISSWGDKEIKTISNIINDSTALSVKFNSLGAFEFINALIEQANGSNKKSLFSKIFNQQKELPVEEVETKIEVIKNELNDIKIKSAKIKNIINAKKRRVLVLANVLSVIVENVTIEDDFLFSAIHDKNIFLLNCYTQLLNVDKLNQDLDNDVYILESKIKEAIDFTIPSIKLSRVALN